MTTASHSQGRLGAGHRAKLKKWSEKVAREDDARAAMISAKGAAARRWGTLEVAREKLRKLFH